MTTSDPSSQLCLPLEGRLLAHRRLLVKLVALLERNHDLVDWLEERSVYRDGQEDPGAVGGAGLELELALVDEYRLLKLMVEGKLA